MSQQVDTVVEGILGLRAEVFRARSSFRAYESIQKLRAPNAVGFNKAYANTKTLDRYKGFMNITEHALQTEFIISLAKVYDDKRGKRSIPNLLDYLRENLIHLRKNRPSQHHRLSRRDVNDLSATLKTLSPKVTQIKNIRNYRVARPEMRTVKDILADRQPTEFEPADAKINELTYAEIEHLIHVAGILVNRISELITGDSVDFEHRSELATKDFKHLLHVIRTINNF